MQAKLVHLRRIVRELESAVVALSGGVDSTLVARVAADELGDRALAVIGESATLPEKEKQEAIQLAKTIGIRWRVIRTEETDNLKFRSNPADRCYFCKNELFEKLRRIADSEGYRWVVDGTNADDVGDYRPGLRANREWNVRSPLREAGFGKQDIRAAAKELGLPNWDKPSMPCLSSRFPYGQPIDVQALRQVEKAEAFLRERGLRECRVRHFGDTARIEIEISKLRMLLDDDFRNDLIAHFKSLGYIYITLDLEGFRSGSLNAVLNRKQAGQQ
ncbi:MAG: ATP-dependent sacrificial sulfur transferase LarE [candidate division KSB1 bacterium]|nr:ATP-dependent sacrificial sulfur transferase LarE [candidate division KSB1 bacterium]